MNNEILPTLPGLPDIEKLTDMKIDNLLDIPLLERSQPLVIGKSLLPETPVQKLKVNEILLVNTSHGSLETKQLNETPEVVKSTKHVDQNLNSTLKRPKLSSKIGQANQRHFKQILQASNSSKKLVDHSEAMVKIKKLQKYIPFRPPTNLYESAIATHNASRLESNSEISMPLPVSKPRVVVDNRPSVEGMIQPIPMIAEPKVPFKTSEQFNSQRLNAGENIKIQSLVNRQKQREPEKDVESIHLMKSASIAKAKTINTKRPHGILKSNFVKVS